MHITRCWKNIYIAAAVAATLVAASAVADDRFEPFNSPELRPLTGHSDPSMRSSHGTQFPQSSESSLSPPAGPVDSPQPPVATTAARDDGLLHQILYDRFQREKAPDVAGAAAAKPKPWYEKFRIRGYTQFRYSDLVQIDHGSARPNHAGDASISDDDTFLIRRARLILFGDVSPHLFVYFQPDFVNTPPGSRDQNHFPQIRDWYGDVYVDTDKQYRFRVGQSKVPYGWENLQSSSNRLPFDRNDAFNSATKNERDLGVFFYWTPLWAQKLYREINDKRLKHSGNYGVFGFGAYDGQGGSLGEQNNELHIVSRFNVPFQLPNGQYLEAAIQGYTGRYVVLGSRIRPLGLGTSDIIPAGTKEGGNPGGLLDQRLGWSFIWYPQPLGFQAEWTIGRGPALNEEQTALERRSVYGGYAMALYRIDSSWGRFFPFVRWQYFRGGYRSFDNAPFTTIDEWNIGIEWQIRREFELSFEYLITDRTNLRAISSSSAVSRASYGQFDGQVARIQFQVNY